MSIKNLFLFIPAFYISASVALAATQSFETWLTGLRQEAAQKGVSSQTINTALSGIHPISRIIELDRKQPEGTMTFAQYKDRVISQDRINKGRRMMREHSAELARASSRFGVPANVIVALWGMETSYGDNTGGFGVIPALATLAYDGRRSSFFRKELLNALEILDQGHIDHANMRGSWAGAMGQNQFMPSSFNAYAVDGNGDGKRDIWTSLPDVFASTANYLSRHGWKEEERWGRAVRLSQAIPESLSGLDYKKTLQEWRAMGVTLPGGGPLPVVRGMEASLVRPDGANGPAFLVYDNFRVIMKWNKSTYFATSVGLLSDYILQ